MTTNANKLLEAAMKLSDEEREEIALRLMDSLALDSEETVKEAWDKEIARRIKEIDDGTVEMIPWAQFRREIAEDGNGMVP